MSDIRVLVVDVEPLMCLLIKGYLREIPGIEFIGEAANGRDAAIQAESLHPDIVLMDIALEGRMDGVDSALEIIRRFTIPIIFLTGQFGDDVIDRAIATSPVGYIFKPFQQEEFDVGIRLGIHKFRLEEKLKEQDRKHVHEKTVLDEIGKVVSSSLDIGEFYDQFAENVGKLIPWDRITVALIREDQDSPVNVYIRGVEIAEFKEGTPAPVRGTALETLFFDRVSLIHSAES